MCQERAENVKRTCIARRMRGKCAENVHRLHDLPGQDVQKMCIVQDCAQIVYRLCIIYMTVPSKNSSPSSNSIPNSILSLRFLSLGMFRMFLVLARVRVDIRLPCFFQSPSCRGNGADK